MSAAESTDFVERQTSQGRVRGLRREGVEVFWGLRYAAPARRFRAAEPPRAWEGVHDATEPRAMAPQRPMDGSLGPVPPGGYSEDCLFLNVFVPDQPAPAPRPVLVWIHGGSLTEGAANQYDGSLLAQGADAVVVCINYRLGLLGTLDLRRFGPPYGHSGELWLLDQVTALRWVREHIAAFGGDPGCVTILGESAGATSVLALCATSFARGLFHRAVACSPGRFAMGDDARDDRVERIARLRRINLHQARDYLLQAPVDELVKLSQRMDLQYAAGTGTPMLPEYTARLIAGLGQRAVPLITGYAEHEGDCFEAVLRQRLRPRWLGSVVLPLILGRIADRVAALVAGGEKLKALYLKRLRAHSRVRSTIALADLVWTDFFRRSSMEHAEAASAANGCGYVYRFRLSGEMFGQPLRPTHGMDIAYTFNWYEAPPDLALPFLNPDPRAREIARNWVATIARFARSGDPSGPLGSWPPYEPRQRQVMQLELAGGRLEADTDGSFRKLVWTGA